MRYYICTLIVLLSATKLGYDRIIAKFKVSKITRELHTFSHEVFLSFFFFIINELDSFLAYGNVIFNIVEARNAMIIQNNLMEAYCCTAR